MKTAAAYIRVSTDDQVEYSPASQLEKIREYAKRNGYILPDEYIFMDEGISGRHTAKRAAFNQMIGAAKQKPKPFDAILLWKFSRFARNREDSIVYKSMLRKQCGIDVISISENLGDDKMSILIEALIEAMDEYYSINLSEEVKRGMNEKASRGEAVSIPSFGYNIENGRYIPDPETAPAVRKIYTDYLNGKGMRTIAAELNNNGFRTRRGNKFENRTIQYILRNPVYVGKIRWTPTGKAKRNQNNPDTMIISGMHEPIIDDMIWNKVQEKLNSVPKTKYMRQDSPKSPFMLQGLVRCSACGATLCQAASRTSLQCYAYAHGKCTVSHGISINKINQLVIDALKSSCSTRDFKIEAQPVVQGSNSEDYPAQIRREQKKLERIKDAYENGVYTLDEYKESRQQIQNRIDEIELQQANSVPMEHKAAVELLRDKTIEILPALCSPAVPEEVKNSLLKSFIKRIVFYRSACNVDIFFYA